MESPLHKREPFLNLSVMHFCSFELFECMGACVWVCLCVCMCDQLQWSVILCPCVRVWVGLYAYLSSILWPMFGGVFCIFLPVVHLSPRSFDVQYYFIYYYNSLLGFSFTLMCCHLTCIFIDARKYLMIKCTVIRIKYFVRRNCTV